MRNMILIGSFLFASVALAHSGGEHGKEGHGEGGYDKAIGEGHHSHESGYARGAKDNPDDEDRPARKRKKRAADAPSRIAERGDAGFRLADGAEKALGITTRALKGKTFSVPASALVDAGKGSGVYRLRNGWYALVPVRTKGKKATVKITPKESGALAEGDLIVIGGADELQAEADGG